MSNASNQKKAPLWDNGKAFFDLLRQDLVRWDSRDCFSIETTEKLVHRLSTLDPTHFVAKSYIAALMKSCMHAVNFDLGRILYDENVKQWMNTFKVLKEDVESAYLPHLDNFLTRLKDKVSHMEVDVDLGLVDMAKLLRDALCATDIRIDWVYAYEGEAMTVNNFSTKLYRYPSIKALELDIINNVLPFGCHLVGVDTVQGKENKVTNVIVCNTPNRAFMLSNMYFAFSQNEMASSQENNSSYHMYSEARTHFPKWENIGSLPVHFGENKYQFSDISCLEPKQALWALMTMELASIMVTQVEPEKLSASVALLDYKNDAGCNLPSVWIPPFELAHKSMAELIEDFGINDDPNKEWLLSLIEDITTAHLLPDFPMIGFDVMAREAVMELEVDRISSSVGLNRFGNPPKESQSGMINLYPKPSNAYGTDEQITESMNKILEENFSRVLSSLKSQDWYSHIETTEKWFKRALMRKFDSVVACFEENKNYENFKPRNYSSIFNPQMGHTSPYIRYKICHHIDNDNDPMRLLSVAATRIGAFSSEHSKHIGFKTEKVKCESFIVCPMDWQDICKLLDCKRSSLPKPLRNWHRTADYTWASRGVTKPLMAVVYV
jgi:hypothetical protein